MKTFTLENPPSYLNEYQKTATIEAEFIQESFKVETQEGTVLISVDTVDDWENGYFIAYPSDGSRPYSISPKFMRENYEVIVHN